MRRWTRRHRVDVLPLTRLLWWLAPSCRVTTPYLDPTATCTAVEKPTRQSYHIHEHEDSRSSAKLYVAAPFLYCVESLSIGSCDGQLPPPPLSRLRGTGSDLPSDAQGTLNLRASAWYFLCVNADGRRAMLGSLSTLLFPEPSTLLLLLSSVTASASDRPAYAPCTDDLLPTPIRTWCHGLLERSPLLRPAADPAALTASCLRHRSYLCPFPCRHCELLDSATQARRVAGVNYPAWYASNSLSPPSRLPAHLGATLSCVLDGAVRS